MNDFRLAFVGGGNMAASLIGGLVQAGMAPERISVAEPDEHRRQALAGRFGVRVEPEAGAVVDNAEVVVLAVKPQVLRPVAESLAGRLAHRPLVLSVAAGVRVGDLSRWLGGGLPVVRAMPNTPALVGSGATGLYAPPEVPEALRERAETVMRAVGVVVWVERESLMDVVTAVSGSGPAYFLYLMEALERAGTALGLAPETARLLTLETALGAARLALESSEPVAELRRRVTSPGGTTEAALRVLEEGGVQDLFQQAVSAARARSEELAEALGKAEASPEA